MLKRSVLVTGGAGYLGSVLTEELTARGHKTIVFDNGLTSPGFPQSYNGHNVSYIQGDVRDSGDLASALKGVDSVVHLAGIVGDPACNADRDLAWEINYLGTIRLVESCRKAGVRRFIFASSCSNYGFQADSDADEWSPLNPQSIYAQTKIQSEHYLLLMRDDAFSPCILRFATLYGLSPRMRFDLALNIMTVKAVLEKEVTVYGGEQWRPFLHVRDAAQAIIQGLERTSSRNVSEIYNCGSDTENYRLKEIGQLIAQEVPGTNLSVLHKEVDKRNYRVNFARIHRDFNFTCQRQVINGIREIQAAVQKGLYHDYALPQYSNHLLALRTQVKGQDVSILR